MQTKTSSCNPRSFRRSLAMIAVLAGLLSGFELGLISDDNWQQAIQCHFSGFDWTLISVLCIISAIIGLAISAYCVSLVQRKHLFQLAVLLSVIGSGLLIIADNHILLLLIGRVALSLFLGLALFYMPLLFTGLASGQNQLKASITLLNQIATMAGQVIAVLFGALFFLRLLNHKYWQDLFLIDFVLGFILFLSLLYLPCKLLWQRYQQDQPACNYSWISLFKKPYRLPIIIGLTLGLLQQIFCLLFLTQYSGFLQLLLGVTVNACSIALILLSERYGRRFLLITSALLLLGFLLSNDLSRLDFLKQVLLILTLSSAVWLVILSLRGCSPKTLEISFLSAALWFASFITSIVVVPMMAVFIV